MPGQLSACLSVCPSIYLSIYFLSIFIYYVDRTQSTEEMKKNSMFVLHDVQGWCKLSVYSDHPFL